MSWGDSNACRDRAYASARPRTKRREARPSGIAARRPRLAAILGEPVLDYQLLLDPAEPDGYVRQWQAPGLAPERHWSYAGQWLVLAVGAVAAAVVILFKAWRREA